MTTINNINSYICYCNSAIYNVFLRNHRGGGGRAEYSWHAMEAGGTCTASLDLKHLSFKMTSASFFRLPCLCCGSILSLVQILFSFVFGYGNV